MILKYKKYRDSHKAERAKYQKTYFALHKREHYERQKKYREEKPEIVCIRRIVNKMLKGLSRTRSSCQYVGCTSGFLRNHIESLFLPGMSWSNHGEWHVDHIIPISWFPIKEDPSLIFVASHWSNLRPMWSRENIRKGNRFAG